MSDADATTLQPLASISKPASVAACANLTDYAAARAAFSWDAERRRCAGLPGGGLNIAYEALERQLQAGRAAQRAVRFVARDGSCRDFSFAELHQGAARVANLLARLGAAPGTIVCSLLGRGPELHTVALGTLKAGAVFCPLFSAFGPEPIQMRLELAAATVLVTTDVLYARKVATLRARLPALRHVLLVCSPDAALPADTIDLARSMASSVIRPSGTWRVPLLRFR